MKKQLKLAAMILLLMSIAFTGCDSGGGGDDDTDTTDYAALVSIDAASLEINYGGTDSASSVTKNVALPLYGDHDTVITWTSSDTDTIYWTENNIDYCSINGNVNRQESEDKIVTLTAVIEKGGASETKQFVLTVKRMPGINLQSVTEDAANLEVQYAPGDSASSVTQNVFLETNGNCGTVITWSSSLTSTISNAGAVTRPDYQSVNLTVTLTATITKGSTSTTKEFELTVIKAPQTDAQAVAEDKAALAIIYAAGESALHVKSNITLPVTGTCGTVITWSSSNTSVVSNSGVVTATDTPVTVTLTATITKGSVSDTKVFTLTVSNTITFENAVNIKDVVEITVGSETVNVIYVNNSDTSVTFPMGLDDLSTGTITQKFFMSETEVTYALWKTVYDWATDAARGTNRYYFANAGRQGGGPSLGPVGTYLNPVTSVYWGDSIVWCNALTEYYNVNNGTSLECVYTYSNVVIRDSRAANATACDNAVVVATAKGFRLPTSMEWEYAARYRTDSTNTVSGYSNPYFTKGNSASGATDYAATATGGRNPLDNAGETGPTRQVAWYIVNSGTYTKSVMEKNANALGLYDMSGNISEWCFEWYSNHIGSYRVIRGGSLAEGPSELRIGYVSGSSIRGRADALDFIIGFRFCRTK